MRRYFLRIVEDKNCCLFSELKRLASRLIKSSELFCWSEASKDREQELGNRLCWRDMVRSVELFENTSGRIVAEWVESWLWLRSTSSSDLLVSNDRSKKDPATSVIELWLNTRRVRWRLMMRALARTITPRWEARLNSRERSRTEVFLVRPWAMPASPASWIRLWPRIQEVIVQVFWSKRPKGMAKVSPRPLEKISKQEDSPIFRSRMCTIGR